MDCQVSQLRNQWYFYLTCKRVGHACSPEAVVVSLTSLPHTDQGSLEEIHMHMCRQESATRRLKLVLKYKNQPLTLKVLLDNVLLCAFVLPLALRAVI